MRFVDFIILLCALITAGSTFAIAVEVIVGWNVAGPEVMDQLNDLGLDQVMPAIDKALSNPTP